MKQNNTPPTPTQTERFITLSKQLRCLVCQNQSIYESASPLAKDLEQQVAGMINANLSDKTIKAYLVKRYGEFVLFSPPVKINTLFLWGGPVIFLGIGGLLLAMALRRRISPQA